MTILILFQLQLNVFYTKNLKDVSMKWGVINLNTPFNNWSCINTLIHTFRVKFMVLNAIFNNISAILWRSVLLVEEFGVPGENHWPAASHWQTSSTNVVSNTPRLSGIQTHNVSGDRHWLHIIRVTVLNATFTILQLYMAVSFIGEVNWSTRKKPPTCCKSLKNFITSSCIDHEYNLPWADWNLLL
jgi:hypothetical protein